MKKTAIIILLAGCLLLNPAVSALASVQVNSKAAIVVDVETGRILYKKNIHQRRPPASTTKIMTGLLAIEEGDLTTDVTASKRAAVEGGSSIYLVPGETLSLREMVYGLLVKSGNDAAIAIAEHIAGSVDGFVQMMNRKARELGALHTTFKNPNGLPASGHLTTAYDLAQIARYAVQNEFFARVVATSKKRISWPQHDWDRLLKNTNKLLTRSEMVDGVKTGYTDAAGRCLVASATQEGQQLISVVLDSKNMWDDSLKLLNYGFDNYYSTTVISRGEVIKQVKIDGQTIKLKAAKKFQLVVSKEKPVRIKKVIEIKEDIGLPVKKGEKVGGVAVCNDNNRLLGRVELIAGSRVEASPLKLFFSQLTSRIQTCF